jgi:hypothetical protein
MSAKRLEERHSRSPSPLVGEGVAPELSEGCDGRGVLTINIPPSVWRRDASASLASQLPPGYAKASPGEMTLPWPAKLQRRRPQGGKRKPIRRGIHA